MAAIEKMKAEKLLQDASNWQKSKTISAYVEALERLTDSDLIDGLPEWLAWARNYAVSIDPLNRPKEIVFVEKEEPRYLP